MKDLVYINGSHFSPEEAKISVYDRGFLFGDAIYEVTRSYGKVLFALEEHLDRLFHSARSIGLELLFSKDQWIKECYEFLNAANAYDCYLRIQVSRGEVKKGPISLKPENTSDANVVMFLHPFVVWDSELYKNGISLQSSEVYRNTKESLDPNIKSGNYLNNIIGLLKRSSYEDCIFLNSEHKVQEGSTFNIYMVKDNVIYTAPDSADILQGITRKILLKLIREESLECRLEAKTLDDFYQADEIFISSSTKEVMGVGKLNRHEFSVGPITQNIAQLYSSYVQNYIKEAERKYFLN